MGVYRVPKRERIYREGVEEVRPANHVHGFQVVGTVQGSCGKKGIASRPVERRLILGLVGGILVAVNELLECVASRVGVRDGLGVDVTGIRDAYQVVPIHRHTEFPQNLAEGDERGLHFVGPNGQCSVLSLRGGKKRANDKIRQSVLTMKAALWCCTRLTVSARFSTMKRLLRVWSVADPCRDGLHREERSGDRNRSTTRGCLHCSDDR